MKLTTEHCTHPEWVHIGTNKMGTWWNCTECGTTGLNKDQDVKNVCIRTHKKGVIKCIQLKDS